MPSYAYGIVIWWIFVGFVIGFRSGKGLGTLRILKYALRQQREVHVIPVFMKADDE